MQTDNHIVTGIYASRAEAETARSRMIERGLPRERAKVVERARADDDNSQLSEADSVLKNVMVDGTVGTLLGTGLGALGEMALVAANVTLFVASPVTAPLAMLGWGAAVGGLVGAAVGADAGTKKGGKFSDLVHHAIRSGHVTLIVDTRNEQEKALASEVLGDSLAERHELRAT